MLGKGQLGVSKPAGSAELDWHRRRLSRDVNSAGKLAENTGQVRSGCLNEQLSMEDKCFRVWLDWEGALAGPVRRYVPLPYVLPQRH